MPTPLSFGLIGAGWIGSFHAETLASRLPNARLVAVADPVPGAAERLSAPRAYRDPLELIADPSIEAVAICSPAASHADLVVAAAQAGKHVFCEKPMALTLDDADRAVDAAQRRGGRAAGRFQPPLRRRLRRHARPGRQRRDRHASTSAVADPRPRHLHRCRRPGEAVDDLQRDTDPRLRHAVLAQSRAPGSPRYSRRPTRWCIRSSPTTGSSTPRWCRSGSTTALSRSPRPASRRCTATTSVARCSAPAACCRPGAHREHASSANAELFADAYVAQFAHFVDCVQAGIEPSVTGADARVALEIALAARESVETAAPVSLNAVLR